MNGSTNGTLTNDPDSKEILILNVINLYVNDVLGSIIFTLGVLFNILSFIYFQLSQSFRDTSMRYYLSVLSITDSLRLSEWFFLFLLNKKIIFLNKPICSSFLYTTMTSGNISVWLLVFLSIERFVILRFPFKGREFYRTRNSIRILCAVILILLLVDIPYLLPNFVQGTFINYDLNLHMCITNPTYRTYMFINNIFVYAVIPFILLMVFNCLLISSLARHHNEMTNVMSTNDNSLMMSQKRERHFKERTIILMSVTFFLILTVSPRYIAQMTFVFTKQTSLTKVMIAKCLFILEMLNFGINFLFYILLSKTSRKEFYLMCYYFFYWKWSTKERAIPICKHPKHQSSYSAADQISLAKNGINLYRRQSASSVSCFLANSSRLKSMRKSHSHFSQNGTTLSIRSIDNRTRHSLQADFKTKLLAESKKENSLV